MATISPITPAPGFNAVFASYGSALSLRVFAHTDTQVELANDIIEPLFDAVVTHKACDLSSIISKCSAIVSEFGDGEVPSCLVEGILFDLIAMEASQ